MWSHRLRHGNYFTGQIRTLVSTTSQLIMVFTLQVRWTGSVYGIAVVGSRRAGNATFPSELKNYDSPTVRRGAGNVDWGECQHEYFILIQRFCSLHRAKPPTYRFKLKKLFEWRRAWRRFIRNTQSNRTTFYTITWNVTNSWPQMRQKNWASSIAFSSIRHRFQANRRRPPSSPS